MTASPENNCVFIAVREVYRSFDGELASVVTPERWTAFRELHKLGQNEGLGITKLVAFLKMLSKVPRGLMFDWNVMRINRATTGSQAAGKMKLLQWMLQADLENGVYFLDAYVTGGVCHCFALRVSMATYQVFDAGEWMPVFDVRDFLSEVNGVFLAKLRG